jgi:Flp pilus assembly protein TadG
VATLKQIRNRRPATSMVQTALALPVCLLLLLGIFEYGRYCMVRNLLTEAAREGARYAAVNTANGTTAAVQAVVTNYLANQQSQLANLVTQVYAADANGNQLAGVAWTNAPFGDTIVVQIDGDYQPVLPVFLAMPSTTHLTVVAIVNSEAN